MEIETKFNVNDLTQRKYDRTSSVIAILEIMEIQSITCYSLTQIFYHCRVIMMKSVFKEVKGKETVYEWIVERTIDRDNNYPKFREDELIPCSDKYKKIVLGK